MTVLIAQVLERRQKIQPTRTTVLTGHREQEDFDRAVALSERFSATWPELNRLLTIMDPRYALVHVLWAIAEELVRRQRRLEHVALVSEQLDKLPEGGRARQEATNELHRTCGELDGIEVEFERHLSMLDTVVEACEKLVRAIVRAQLEREALGMIERSRSLINESEYDYIEPGESTEDLSLSVRFAIDAYQELLQAYGVQ